MKFSKFKELLPYYIVKDKIESYNFKLYRNSSNALPPDLYNVHGERLDVFFLKDDGNPPYTLSLGRNPRYILWDRYNCALEKHFYVHENIFRRTFECKRKYGVLRESEAIYPELYYKAIKYPEIIKDYSLIFTNSEKILDKYENSRFAPANSVWYGTEFCGGVLSEHNCENKDKNISIISSDKSMCEMHKIRSDLTRYYKNSGLVDCYGAAVGKHINKKSEALEQYRYSIVLENNETSLYFTEKILDCFAAMTVPIYVGATKIGDFFNDDGIIQIRKDKLCDFGNVDRIIKRCCESDYNSRLDAIRDNYRRVMEYLCYEDYLFEHYNL